MKTTNLTIQDAIKSGKQFRRPNAMNGTWFERAEDDYDDGFGLRCVDGLRWIMDLEDILATDWEIKREPMTIWVNEYPNGNQYVHMSQNDAEIERGSKGLTRKFIEVLD